MKKYTVITGASSGLGKAFAQEFASRDHHLILISLPNDGLGQVVMDLKTKHPDLDIFGCELDLSQITSIEQLKQLIEDNNLQINFLVNNAGIGGSSNFQDVDIQYIDRIIQLNIRATTLLIHTLLPYMLQHTSSYILNVSSIAAFSPLPYKMVYPASKAFIYSFSRGLHAEFRHTGLQVSVVLPGAMPTNRQVNERINKHGWLGKISMIKPQVVARYAINAMYNGKTIIIPGFVNQINYLIFKYLPYNLIQGFIKKTLQNELLANAALKNSIN